MQVNFNGNAVATGVKLPPLKSVDEPTTPVVSDKKGGFSTKELWKDTLKVKANVDAYSAGALRGVKNSILAGAGLVGIDWIVNSGYKLGKGTTTIAEVLKTPFNLAGKAVKTSWRFVFGGDGTKSIFNRSLGNTIKRIAKFPIDLYTKIYKADKTLSRVSRYGLPILVAGVAIYTTFLSYLNANKEKADIDHRYGGRVGHH